MLSYTRRTLLVPVRPGHFSSWLKPALLLLLLTGGTWLHAATVSGTVKDPSGAVIAEAKIEITGADLVEPVVVFSDGLGKFASPDLRTGRYVVRIIKDGFEPQEETVDLPETADLQIILAIARQKIGISVPGNALAFASSDPLYRQLREIGLGQTFRVDNFALTWEAATFQFRKGTLFYCAQWMEL